VAPVPEMMARNAPSNVRICTLRGTKIMRSICALMPAGYQSRPARAMVEVLREVSRSWCAGKVELVSTKAPRAA
jgi:hypothetical protein